VDEPPTTWNPGHRDPGDELRPAVRRLIISQTGRSWPVTSLLLAESRTVRAGRRLAASTTGRQVAQRARRPAHDKLLERTALDVERHARRAATRPPPPAVALRRPVDGWRHPRRLVMAWQLRHVGTVVEARKLSKASARHDPEGLLTASCAASGCGGAQRRGKTPVAWSGRDRARFRRGAAGTNRRSPNRPGPRQLSPSHAEEAGALGGTRLGARKPSTCAYAKSSCSARASSPACRLSAASAPCCWPRAGQAVQRMC